MADQDNSNSQSSSSSAAKFVLPIILVIIAVAAIGYFAMMKTGLDAKLVEARIDEWIAYQEKQYPTTDYQYDRIEMAGSAADRYAIVHGAKLINTERFNDETYETSVSIERFELHPESPMFDAFVVKTEGPIVIDNGFDEPMKWYFTPALTSDITIDKDGETTKTNISQDVGGLRIDIRSEDEDDNVRLAFGEGANLNVSYAVPYNKGGSMTASLPDIVISKLTPLATGDTQEGEAGAQSEAEKAKGTDVEATEVLTVENISLDSDWKKLDQDNGQLSVEYKISGLDSARKPMEFGKLNLALDVDYEGPVPNARQQADTGPEAMLSQIDFANQKAHIKLNEFSVAADEAKMALSLDVTTGHGELLPLGTGELRIDNFAYVLAEMKKHGFGGKEEKMLEAFVSRITGKELETISDLVIPLERTEGGSFAIGESSFEELFTMFLTGGQIPPSQSGPAASDEGGEDLTEKDIEGAFDE